MVVCCSCCMGTLSEGAEGRTPMDDAVRDEI